MPGKVKRQGRKQIRKALAESDWQYAEFTTEFTAGTQLTKFQSFSSLAG